jgi:hypothetical protein
LAFVVTERVRDAAGKLSATATQTAMDTALAEYSRDKPRSVVVLVEGDGGFDYPVDEFGAAEAGATASTQWAPGFSVLRDVIYPYDPTARVLPSLEADTYAVVTLPDGETLRFLAHTPSATEDFLVTFTRPHEVTQAVGTVPACDEAAVCSLAAACALDSLAALYAQATDSTFNADVADHRGRSSEYQALARTYRQQYYIHVGRKANGDGSARPAASGRVDLDGAFGDPWRTDRFFHGRRRF